MKIFVLKSCDTCRKAVRELRENGVEPQIVDVMSDGVGKADIGRFLAAFGEDTVNRRSTTWRGLAQTERQLDPATLLATHPKLMKRPIIDAEGQLYLGWGAKVRQDLLGLDPA